MRWLTFNHQPLYTLGIMAGLSRRRQDVRVVTLTRPVASHREQITRAVDTYRPDVVFTPGWSHDLVDPTALFWVLKRKGVPHVYWATEDPTFFYDVSLKFAPYSDLVLTTTCEYVDRYSRMGVPAGLLLFACNPELHHPLPPSPALAHEAVLVANNYFHNPELHPTRLATTRQMLLPLVAAGLDVKVFGLWWDHPDSPFRIPATCIGGPLAYTEVPRVYASAQIVLGVQFDAGSRTQTSCRVFEVLGCGSFHLTPNTPATAALFEDGVHLALSHSPEHTVEVARFYLDHPLSRERVARAGRRYVLAHHTYDHRARELLRLVKQVLGLGDECADGDLSSVH